MACQKSIRIFVLSMLVAAFGTAAQAAVGPTIDIPYQKFVLDNGLVLIVHEDHKAPIVAVNIWYHVGSKNEKPGRTGFAHLFEHLMFNGSEHFNEDYFKQLEPLGASDLNGTTSNDRTNYFQNIPKSALDRVLWLESDRMGHLLGAITQAKLDEQRGVVQNEKRQFENEPYSVSEELITKSVFPAGHPYSWTVIGSMEDLSAAKLEDVHEWFKTYYGPSNAVLAVAGDITAAEALEKVKNYFGDIPAGPPISHFEEWIAPRTGVQRQRVQDRVPAGRVYKVWNSPPIGTADNDYLNLAGMVLSSGKSSRLYKRLVYDDQTAASVTAYADEREIGSLFQVEATAKPGGDLKAVEKAVDEEMARFVAAGPTDEEIERVKAQAVAGFVRGIERIGGFGGKSDILARSQVYSGSPDAWKTGYDRIRKATAADVKAAVQRWLSDGVYILEVLPFPDYKAATAGADRSKMPDVGPAPSAQFPAMRKATLSNGLKIVLAERKAIPVIEMRLLLDAGYAADQGLPTGTASLAMDVLDEGTKRRSALQISDELQRLGAHLSTGSDLDASSVSLSALTVNLDASLDLFADVILNPAFPEADFLRLKAQRIAAIRREKSSPVGMALRVFPPLLYGKNHAYGLPFTGSGYEETVQKIAREDLVRFHKTWFQPDRATLVVVGDVSLDQIKPKLDALFKDWHAVPAPGKNLKEVPPRQEPAIYLIDRPGSVQSMILAGQVVPPSANPDEIPFETMRTILGGMFISRVNMNLREDKHWTYGAGGFAPDARGQRPYLVYAPVQADKTKEAMQELAKEIRGIRGARPVSAEELSAAKNSMTISLPGQWETNGAVEGSIARLVTLSLPDDYYQTYPGKVNGVDAAAVVAAAQKLIRPEGFVWVVVGDRAKIEGGIKELGWGAIQLIDADGNPAK